MVRISGIYASDALQARRGSGHKKPQAHHRAERAGTKAGVCVTLRPDADGNLRECALEHRSKRVRFDECGFVVRS